MNSKRILVPVDLEQNFFDALEFVAGLSREMSVFATVLYVLNLNISLPERRVQEELCREYEKKLRALVKTFFGSRTPNVSLRIGKPHLEILAEAETAQAELIVMASAKKLRRKWQLNPTTIERVVRDAPCLTLVLPRTWKLAPEQYQKAIHPAFAPGSEQLAHQNS